MGISGTARSAAVIAYALLAAACAETKPEVPVAAAPPVSSIPLGTTQDFFLNVGDRVFFAENSAELTPTSLATLDKQAEWLTRYGNYRITIEGHADEKGAKDKNLKLSQQRADAVRKYFVMKGLEPARIRIVHYGRERRVATCNDMSCWSQNRRVVTVLDVGGPEPLVASRARVPAGPGPAGPMEPVPGRLPTYAPPPPRG